MIDWPTKALTDVVRTNLERLRASGAARELEDAPHNYTIENYAWTGEWPLRFVLRDEHGDRVMIVLEGETDWRIRSFDEAPAVHAA